MVPAATSTVATKAGFAPSAVSTATNSVCGAGWSRSTTTTAGEHRRGGADDRRRDPPAADRAAERDDVAAGLGALDAGCGVDAGEDAIEQSGACDRRLRRASASGCRPISQAATARAERRIGGMRASAARRSSAGKRAEHIFARQGVEFVAVSVRHRGIPSRR